jgi:hypothetical protein
VRVGAVGAEEILAAVFTVPLVTEVPPFESYVTVKVLALQIAYKVKLAVWPCAYPPVKETTDPLLVVDQPLNV